MNSSRRVFLGAFVGAFVVLSVHPASRGLLIPALGKLGRDPRIDSASLQPRTEVLPRRVLTLPDAAAWVETGATLATKSIKPSSEDADRLRKVVAFAKARDSRNSFWALSEISLLEEPTAEKWIEAAKAESFNDYQSDRIIETSRTLGDYGAKAWRWTVLAELRSESSSVLTETFARTLNLHAPLDTDQGLDIRMATLRLGALLRDGARSLRNGDAGQAMVELSSYPPEIRDRSPKRLLLAQVGLFDRLRSRSRDEDVTEANRVFRENEAWVALVDRNQAQETFRTWSFLAILAATLPSMFLFAAVVSGLFLLAGTIGQKTQLIEKLTKGPWPILAGAVTGYAALALTQQWLIALAVMLCNAFLLFETPTQRSKRPKSLGPLFSLTTLVIVLASSLFAGLFFAGFTSPVIHAFEALQVPPEYYAGSSLFAGFFLVTAVLLCLVAPSWGYAFRTPTATALELALVQGGRASLALCLSLAVLTTPLAVALDTNAESNLVEIATNEPLYYYRRTS